MRMNTKRILAALLSLVMLLALAPAGWAVDLTTLNEVTVNLVSQTDYAADIVKASITVDFYLIADAEPVTGYDTYSLKVKDAYKNLQVKTTDDQGTPATSTLAAELEKQVNAEHPSFDEIVETLSKAVLEGSGPTPDKSTDPSVNNNEIIANGLQAGMYLMVPHGTVIPDTEITGKTGNTGYVKTITTGEGTAAQTVYRTRAYSADYEYTFGPQLVTVPGKEIKTGQGESATSIPTYRTDEGTWTNTVPVNVKVERTPRNGILKITKTLTNYADLSKEGSYLEPITFTFSVVGKDKAGNTVYQRVVALSVEKPEDKAPVVTLEDIPVGTTVTVTEVYEGAHANLDPNAEPNPQTVVIQAPTQTAADGTTTTVTSNVNFTNVNNNKHRGGHGIENKFTFNKSTGKWGWVATGGDGATSGSGVQGQ